MSYVVYAYCLMLHEWVLMLAPIHAVLVLSYGYGDLCKISLALACTFTSILVPFNAFFIAIGMDIMGVHMPTGTFDLTLLTMTSHDHDTPKPSQPKLE